MITHLRIAEAQLRGRPRQSLLALVSVTVGTAMLIVTLSLTGGLAEDFIAKSVETAAHVEVLPRRPAEGRREVLAKAGETLALSRHHVPDEKQTVRPLAQVLALARSLPGVVLATPAVEAQAVLSFGTVRRPVLITGVIPQDEALMTVLDERVVEGSFFALAAERDGVILGWQLARNLGVTLGAPLQAASPDGAVIPLRLVGVVRSGLASVDKVLALVNLDRAQALAGLPSDQATKVRIKLTDPLKAPETARVLQEQVGYVCLSWFDRSAAQIEAFDRQNLITRVLVFFTTLVAAFGVANVLVQLVAEKRRDIAILRACGFSRSGLALIFLFQGLLLGFLGATLGWALGAVLIRVVRRIPVDFGEAALLRNENLVMAEYPWYYLLALLLALVVCTVAAVQPARRAASLQPTEILRGEW
ncbi:MAG: ABC transporter permease [Thermoanaerobaculum sp.]|nr:ABC transporter permease [Thermoanaerobaculum sp.]MDW7968323.1 FtsX-like permease family protein [Thermoanaerobaculum sp.]